MDGAWVSDALLSCTDVKAGPNQLEPKRGLGRGCFQRQGVSGQPRHRHVLFNFRRAKCECCQQQWLDFHGDTWHSAGCWPDLQVISWSRLLIFICLLTYLFQTQHTGTLMSLSQGGWRLGSGNCARRTSHVGLLTSHVMSDPSVLRFACLRDAEETMCLAPDFPGWLQGCTHARGTCVPD